MIRRALIVAVAALLTACAAKSPPAPPAVTSPKFPDFVYPVPPQGLGNPVAAERHFVGWQYLQGGDLRAAERNFEAALKQSSAFYPAEVALGYLALAKKNQRQSLQHFDRAIVANPRYAPALAGRAEAMLAAGQTADAVQSIEAALQAAPGDPALGPLRSRLEVLKFRVQQTDITSARKLAESGRLDDARAAYEAAIAASPDSPFLLRELADVERRAGRIEEALAHARKASELEPDEPRSHIMLGELFEAQGDHQHAIDAFTTAVALQPDEAISERIDALRSRAAFEAMPAEYRDIQTSATLTRAQLAALMAVRLEPLLADARRLNAVVITDTRGHWAASYILAMARAGVMEVYPNHTFQPDDIVRRGDLALAASRVLELIAGKNPQLDAAWRNARGKFPDLGPRHLSYPAASVAVAAGVMSPLPDGTFQLTEPVTGDEAVAAVTKLQELGGQPPR